MGQRNIVQAGRDVVSRRTLLKAASLAGAGALTLNFSRGAGEAATKAPLVVPGKDGTYPVVPLRKETIRVAALQTQLRSVDAANPAPGLKSNLQYVLDAIDKANGWLGPQDLVCFNEFPLQGWQPWTRVEAHRVAIEVPGEQSEAIGKKAKEYGCYVSFGAYVKDADWPDHVINITTLVGPDGKVFARHWKSRHLHGAFGGFEMFSTTAYDVLDRFVEMYGWDEVIPVARTDIGNISMSQVQSEPEVFRAMAMKGAEIIVRTATGGYKFIDAQATAMYNGVYCVSVNNAVSFENRGFFEDANGGETAIFDPRGEVIAQAGSHHEQSVNARIPIGAFRKTHRVPTVHMPLYEELFEKYTPRYAPGAFSEYVPTDLRDAARHFKDKFRW